MKTAIAIALLVLALVTTGCLPTTSSDAVQQRQQEILLQEGSAQVGMPNIAHFRERRLVRDILEMRDQDGLTTYTYIWSEFQAKLVKLCNSIGYGIPYATQFTNPEKREWSKSGWITLPQADPNGLFSPASAEGTWIMCQDSNSDAIRPVYVEPRTVTSPFPLLIGIQ